MSETANAMAHSVTPPNVFFFVATFGDGSQIVQNESDTSLIAEDKNCFYDVLERSKKDKPISFVLTNGEMTFGVDLRDGHFEINGVPFFQHRPDLPQEHYDNFKLFYYRTTKIEIDAHTQEITRGYVGGYTLGWETRHKGKKVERKLAFYLDGGGPANS
jgi:hypothetical protein